MLETHSMRIDAATLRRGRWNGPRRTWCGRPAGGLEALGRLVKERPTCLICRRASQARPPKTVWMVALPGRPWRRVLAETPEAIRATHPTASVIVPCQEQTLSVDEEV